MNFDSSIAALKAFKYLRQITSKMPPKAPHKGPSRGSSNDTSYKPSLRSTSTPDPFDGSTEVLKQFKEYNLFLLPRPRGQ